MCNLYVYAQWALLMNQILSANKRSSYETPAKSKSLYLSNKQFSSSKIQFGQSD